MRTIVWWTTWGLAMAVGVIGLFEATHNPYYLLVSIPIMTGAIAAAFRRIQYEYHHAIEHAKWAGISSLFLLAALGFVYAKAQAFGPFSTGSACKAILGTTFGMSVPEVERVLGRSLTDHALDVALQEKAHEWIWQALPLPTRKTDESYDVFGTLFGTRSQITFHFKQRKLCRVEMQFLPLRAEDAARLRAKLQDELAKEYKLVEQSDRRELIQVRYSKESVDAVLVYGPNEDKLINTRVVLDYLPLDAKAPAPLTVESNIF